MPLRSSDSVIHRTRQVLHTFDMEILKPAQLDFFAIYSPALGPTDETLPDQLVYYYAHQSQKPQNTDPKSEGNELTREEQNEQLRNIGLAQGMVSFAQ